MATCTVVFTVSSVDVNGNPVISATSTSAPFETFVHTSPTALANWAMGIASLTFPQPVN
jgi:hypothetical protein